MSIKLGDKVRYYFPVEDNDGDKWKKSDSVAEAILTVVAVDGVSVTASDGDKEVTAPRTWFIKVRQ